jgi:hypothetical protein
MAKNINLKLSGIKISAAGVAKSLGWVFLGAFLILVVLEGFEINRSVQLIYAAGEEPPLVSQEKGVRINFDNYNDVVNRIEQAPNFVPTGGIYTDPFHGNGQKSGLLNQITPPTPVPDLTSTTTPTSTPTSTSTN